MGWFTLGARQVLVLVCSDFWFSEMFHGLPGTPDLVLVATFSVSQRPHPGPSRSLWEHMAVARAYEFGAYVGISDWGHHASITASAAAE